MVPPDPRGPAPGHRRAPGWRRAPPPRRPSGAGPADVGGSGQPPDGSWHHHPGRHPARSVPGPCRATRRGAELLSVQHDQQVVRIEPSRPIPRTRTGGEPRFRGAHIVPTTRTSAVSRDRAEPAGRATRLRAPTAFGLRRSPDAPGRGVAAGIPRRTARGMRPPTPAAVASTLSNEPSPGSEAIESTCGELSATCVAATAGERGVTRTPQGPLPGRDPGSGFAASAPPARTLPHSAPRRCAGLRGAHHSRSPPDRSAATAHRGTVKSLRG